MNLPLPNLLPERHCGMLRLTFTLYGISLKI